jgi:hypothetical protein
MLFAQQQQVTIQSELALPMVMGIAVTVVMAVALFAAIRRKNMLLTIVVFTAFAVAAGYVVMVDMRTATVEELRHADAQNRLEALGRELHARAEREQAGRLRSETEQQADGLTDKQMDRQFAPVVVTPAGLSAAWLPEVDEQFEADIYPSAELASRALIREWLGHFDKLVAKGTGKPEMVLIVCDSRTPSIDTLGLLEAIDELVQQKFPEARTIVTTGPEAKENYEPKGGELAIRLTVSQFVTTNVARQTSRDPSRKAEISGVMTAGFKAPTWSFGLSTRFIEKPWLTATSEFLSLRHGTTYQVVRCSQLASSGEEASRDVLGQAANRLGHLIDPREDQGLPRAASAIMLEQLEAGKYIADRFVQKLKRPYGDVYREAILLDIGNTNLRDMIQVALSETAEHQRATERRSATRISGGLGLLIVLGVLTGLYLLLNWLTKGYYRGPLTVVVCMLGSGAIVSAIMFIGAIV